MHCIVSHEDRRIHIFFRNESIELRIPSQHVLVLHTFVYICTITIQGYQRKMIDKLYVDSKSPSARIGEEFFFFLFDARQNGTKLFAWKSDDIDRFFFSGNKSK